MTDITVYVKLGKVFGFSCYEDYKSDNFDKNLKVAHLDCEFLSYNPNTSMYLLKINLPYIQRSRFTSKLSYFLPVVRSKLNYLFENKIFDERTRFYLDLYLLYTKLLYDYVEKYKLIKCSFCLAYMSYDDRIGMDNGKRCCSNCQDIMDSDFLNKILEKERKYSAK